MLYMICLDRRTQLFIRIWPGVIALTYLGIGFFPDHIFNNGFLYSFYSYSAISIGLLGVLSAVLWKKMWLRNIMASFAVARAVGILIFLGFEQPPLPYSSIIRLVAVGMVGIFVFLLAVVETPYLKAMIWK